MKSAGWRRTRHENNLTVYSSGNGKQGRRLFLADLHALRSPAKATSPTWTKQAGKAGRRLDFESQGPRTPASINVEAIRKQYERGQSHDPRNYTFKSIGDYLIQEAVSFGQRNSSTEIKRSAK